MHIKRVVILLYDRMTSKCADYGSYRSAFIHIQPQLVVQEMLTLAAPSLTLSAALE